MKKIILGFALFLAGISWVFADTYTMTTYYPAPSGRYTALNADNATFGELHMDGGANPVSIIGDATSFDIYQGTADGSDDRRTMIGGGGWVQTTRGAYIELLGNEYAVQSGNLNLYAGSTGEVAVMSGNLGIGTNNPTVALEVIGDIRFSGTICDGTSCSIGVPAGAIMAFNLAACPTGWIIASGVGGTPDLRGAFVRGMYGNLNARDVARGLGSYQADEFLAHSHNYMALNPVASPGFDYTAATGDFDPVNISSSATGGTETRPKNVALIYCQKQ